MPLKNRVSISIIFAILTPLVLAGHQEEKHCSDYLYGLYYGSWDKQGSDLAFVFTRDGQPIPPKANDPDAPTQPGFYVGEQHFEFASSRFSTEKFSFRTKSVNGTVFSFNGRFGCEQVDVIPEVPYLEGELRETRDGGIVRKKKVHLGRAVIL